jgi:hypothetical protein
MSNIEKLLNLPRNERARRFDEMVRATFSHIDSRDLLQQLHPRRLLDIKRRVDGVETWFEGDWLTSLMEARDGDRHSDMLYMGTRKPNQKAEQGGIIGNFNNLAMNEAETENPSRESLDSK